jgi:hypothetical protein
MSGRWEPYVSSVLDEIVASKALTESSADKERWYEWTLMKRGILPEKDIDTAIESDLRQVESLIGGSTKGNKDDPEYLNQCRERYVDYFRKLTGVEPAPFTPIGPSEMFIRNSANLEYSCTALYYCPGQNDDLMMCVAEDFEFDDELWTSASHFRVKSTGAYVYNGGDLEEIINSPYRIIRFEFDRSKRSAWLPIVREENKARYEREFKRTMVKLRGLLKSKKIYNWQDIPGDIDPFARIVSHACYHFEQSQKD